MKFNLRKHQSNHWKNFSTYIVKITPPVERENTLKYETMTTKIARRFQKHFQPSPTLAARKYIIWSLHLPKIKIFNIF